MKNLKFLSIALLFSSLAIAGGNVNEAKNAVTSSQAGMASAKAEHARLLGEIDGHQNALSQLKGKHDKAAEIEKHNEAIRTKSARVNALADEHKTHTERLARGVRGVKGGLWTHRVADKGGKYHVVENEYQKAAASTQAAHAKTGMLGKTATGKIATN